MTKSTRMTGYMEPNNKYYVVQPIIIFLSDVHAHWLCKWNIRALLQYFPFFSFLLVETHFMFKILVIHRAAVKMKEKLLHLFYICCFTQHSQLMLICNAATVLRYCALSVFVLCKYCSGNSVLVRIFFQLRMVATVPCGTVATVVTFFFSFRLFFFFSFYIYCFITHYI